MTTDDCPDSERFEHRQCFNLSNAVKAPTRTSVTSAITSQETTSSPAIRVSSLKTYFAILALLSRLRLRVIVFVVFAGRFSSMLCAKLCELTYIER